MMLECGAHLSFRPKQSILIPGQVQALHSKVKLRWWNGVEASQSKDNKNSKEIRVCQNKACIKSGSRETLRYLRGLAPPDVQVKSCGCLGRCGSGPNSIILPEEIFVSHCATASHAARLLANQCGASDPENNLNALLLKEQGNKEFEHGNAVRAEQLYSQAIDLNPSGGMHFLYANRSAARLAIGDHVGSLSDAKEASRIAPNWHVGYLNQGDVYSATGEYRAAENAYLSALTFDPSLHRSKSFKAQIQKLKEKMVVSNSSS